MKLLCFFALGVFTLTACAQDEQQPGFMRRTLKTSMEVVKKPFAGFGKRQPPLTNELQMEMKLNPEQVVLAETRQIQATLSLTNKSKKLVQLEFPSTQRIEVVIRNSQGKSVVQWSEDETFTGDPGFVAINPGEHVEYTASLATRDLGAGQLYTVEGFFPKYPQLRAHRLVTPLK
jgi:hypothetical protein